MSRCGREITAVNSALPVRDRRGQSCVGSSKSAEPRPRASVLPGEGCYLPAPIGEPQGMQESRSGPRCAPEGDVHGFVWHSTFRPIRVGLRGGSRSRRR